MTGISAVAPSPAEAGLATPTVREDLKMLAYWISLGAAAGGLGGVVVGGIGGRLAMFLLRFTSDESVRGLESDDGFIIGRFNFLDTLNLLVTTAFLGVLVGLIVVFGRPFLPRRGMPFAWAVAGATIGAQVFISGDGVDFTRLGPHWLAFSLFVAIPAVGAGVIAWLVNVYPRFWKKDRKWTGVAAVAALPLIIVFPVGVAVLLVGAMWLVAIRSAWVRKLPARMPVRVAAIVVFVAIVAIGVTALLEDAGDVL